jgi:tRNA threonylcarbamoyl adenosine modification protein YeaZ
MAKFIAWDTSAMTGALVAMEGDATQLHLITELFLHVDLSHSERLLWGIHQVLEAARWTLKEVDFFGVGVGPGSFTGLRVGLTTARTLAGALKKPLIGVSSLAALARPIALQFSLEAWPYPTFVVATRDACKGELFSLCGLATVVRRCAAFSLVWHSDVTEGVSSPDRIVRQVEQALESIGPQARWVAVGEGRKRYLEAWANLPSEQEMILSQDGGPEQVQGRYLGLLVWEVFQDQKADPTLWRSTEVLPRYLRASSAELKRFGDSR